MQREKGDTREKERAAGTRTGADMAGAAGMVDGVAAGAGHRSSPL